ncbi:SRPBCC family protein [Streptosporangium longisporum]|uniref:Polyketide cyclase n=2 Tax=Streptosporangium longisporum TaxID=46187 RepID=A0ABN3Y2G5_9ACTN
MDTVTGTQVAVTLPVPIPRERMWDTVTAVDRTAEWSPEVIGGGWCDGARGPVAGARFIGRNRFPGGHESMVTCVVVEAERPDVFAWAVLDDTGRISSTWRYELREGDEPGSTLVHHSFTHGPGASDPRRRAGTDPRVLDDRLVTLCQNMITTIAAMTTADSTTGATR